MAAKVLIFSDIHVHPHKRSTERLNDCLKTLQWVFDVARDNNIEDILFLGDLFHDRQKIDILTYQKTFEIFRDNLESSKIRIRLLLGNHDLWHYQKWDISSVFPLKAIRGVEVIDRPSTIEVLDHKVSFLPYTHDPIEDLKAIKNDSKFKLLCGHIAIDGAILNRKYATLSDVPIEHDGDMTKVTCDIFDGWDQTFLGHYHAEQKLDFNVEYVGSPLQLSFGEAFQHKHVIIYDLETHTKEYVRNKFSPQHFIIPLADIDKYDLNKNFIRLEVSADSASSDLIEIKSDILKNNKVGSLEIKPTKAQEAQHDIGDVTDILSKHDEMISKYVDEVEKTCEDKLKNLDKTKLLSIGDLICKKACEEASTLEDENDKLA